MLGLALSNMTGRTILITLISLILQLPNATSATSCPGSPQFDVTFNEINNTFNHPYTFDSSTPVGNLTLYIRKDFFTNFFGNKTSVSLEFFFQQRGHLAIDDVEVSFPIDDDAALGIGTQRQIWTQQMMNQVTISSAEYTECMSEDNTTYLSIPVVFLLQRGPRVVGRRRWVIDLRTISSGEMSMNVAEFNLTVVTVIAKPVQKCNQLRYIFENDTCVSECPCYLKTFPNFCYDYSGGDFSRAVTNVPVSANISNGTIATIDVLFAQSVSPVGTTFSFITNYVGVRGDQMHDKSPTVTLNPIDDLLGVKNPTFLSFPITSLNRSNLANCSQYQVLPLQLELVSQSIDQLGEHVINIMGSILNESAVYEFTTLVVVNVETNTSCIDEPNNLLHLPDQQCVSECPCGFIPFRHPTTPYCEPVGIARPAWFADDQLRIVANEGTSTNVTFRVYMNSTFQISKTHIFGFSTMCMVSTDSVTMLLRIEQISSSALQSSLQFDNELDQSLNISLNNSYLETRGLESCNESDLSYIAITSVISEVPEAGEYSFNIVARFTSTENETETDLRDSNRRISVTQVLRVNLEAISITPTMAVVTSTVPIPIPSVLPELQIIVVLSIKTFTSEKEIAFKKTVADSVNMHCQKNEDQCRSMNKRQAIAVTADDVVVSKDMEIDGGVQIQFYVRRMGEVIPPQAVVSAVENNLQAFMDRNITVDGIMVAVSPSIASSTVTPSMTPPGPDIQIIIAIVVTCLFIAAVAIIVIAVILVIVLVKCCNESSATRHQQRVEMR